MGQHEILDGDDVGFSFSHLVHEAEGTVKSVVKKVGKTAFDVAARAARTEGNVAVFVEDKAGKITKKIVPGTWANKYIDEATGKLKAGTRGAAHFANNVLEHGPGEIQKIYVHPISSADSALTATDKWANKK